MWRTLGATLLLTMLPVGDAVARAAAAAGAVAGAAAGADAGAVPAPTAGRAADTPPTAGMLLPAAGLQADVRVLRRAFESLHPGLLRYRSADETALAFEVLEAEFARDRTLADAYLALARFTAGVRCGHTWPSFFNQRDAVRAALFDRPTRLPFWFDWLGGRMVVTRDFTPGAALPVGTEILRVDGVPAAKLLEALLPYARADGGNDAKRVAQLAVRGDSEYEAFDALHPLLYPVGAEFVLDVRRPGAAPVQLRVAPLMVAQRKSVAVRMPRSEAPVFEWRDAPDGSAYLRMPTWAVYASKWDWRGWLNARLDELVARDAPALIVDLRGNEGGLDVGDEILKRLIDAPLVPPPSARLVRYRAVAADLRPYLDTWDPSFADWGARAVPLERPWPTAPPVEYFALRNDADEGESATLQPAERRYRGRVFVLVDAVNSSATFQFARRVQEQGLGTLVGQPTGGNRRGINGGAFFFLRLPNSGLEVDLPLIGYFPAEPQPDAGLVPDVVVPRSAEDLAAGRDAELAAVAALRSAK
jgi:hypothetical protein